MEKINNVISLEEVRKEKSNDVKFVEKTGLFNTKPICSHCADNIDLTNYADGSHSWNVINDTVEIVRAVKGKESIKTVPLQKVVDYWLRHYLHSYEVYSTEEQKKSEEEQRKKNRKLLQEKELELLQSYCDYVILAVKEELPKRGIKFNRSNKCLSHIRKILREIEERFYTWEWDNCITKGWFIENEEKINQLVPIRNPEENRDNESNKNKRSNREWFGCNELVKECHGLIGIDIYWNNPLFGGFDIHVPYRVRKKNTLDYLILNS